MCHSEQQTFLDGGYAPNTRQMPRTTDADTSHQAVERVNASEQCWLVLRALDSVGGSVTSGELAHFSGIDLDLICRRLPDLEKRRLAKRGAVRPCRQLGSNQTTWGLIGGQSFLQPSAHKRNAPTHRPRRLVCFSPISCDTARRCRLTDRIFRSAQKRYDLMKHRTNI